MKTLISMKLGKIVVSPETLETAAYRKLRDALESAISSEWDTSAVSAVSLPSDLDDAAIVCYTEADDNGKETFYCEQPAKVLRDKVAASLQAKTIQDAADAAIAKIGYVEPAPIVSRGKKSVKGKRALPGVTSVASLFAPKA